MCINCILQERRLCRHTHRVVQRGWGWQKDKIVLCIDNFGGHKNQIVSYILYIALSHFLGHLFGNWFQ